MIQNRPERPYCGLIFSRKPASAGVGLVNELVVNNFDDNETDEGP